VVSSERYSGRIRIQIPGAAIAQSHDIITAVDGYFVMYKNGRYVDHSEVVENDQLPSWQTVFVEDYKYGDSLLIRVMDDDSESDRLAQSASQLVGAIGGMLGAESRPDWRDPDDHIDDIHFSSYPETDIYHGEKGEATIHLISEPTTLPRGTYWSEGSEVVNIFKYGNLSSYEDNGLTAALVKKAERTAEESHFMVTLLSWTVPELAIGVLMSEARFAYQLAAGILGTSLMEEKLSASTDALTKPDQPK
jgi:hypothetical protein